MSYKKTKLREKVKIFCDKLVSLSEVDEYILKAFCTEMEENSKMLGKKAYDDIKKFIGMIKNNETRNRSNISTELENLSLDADTDINLYNYLINASSAME
jgi:hypothetical protein